MKTGVFAEGIIAGMEVIGNVLLVQVQNGFRDIGLIVVAAICGFQVTGGINKKEAISFLF